MKYHVKLELARGNPQYWWNWNKDKLTADLLIPLVNGHVVLVTRSGQKRLLNMKNVTVLTVYKTSKSLLRTKSGGIPSELKDRNFQQKHGCTAELLAEVQVTQSTEATRSLIQRALSKPKDQVFVVMKFGDKPLDSAYEGVIVPEIERQGLKVVRIDEIQDSGKITDQVLEAISSSKYILADLSGERPNCYYECGFAHALGKELILTIRSSDSIHFDLAGYRFITWETEAELRRKLRIRFESLMESDGN